MSLKSFFNDPKSGELLSGYIVLMAAISFVSIGIFALASALLRGDFYDLRFRDVGPFLLVAIAIPSIVKFLRSRHAR